MIFRRLGTGSEFMGGTSTGIGISGLTCRILTGTLRYPSPGTGVHGVPLTAWTVSLHHLSEYGLLLMVLALIAPSGVPITCSLPSCAMPSQTPCFIWASILFLGSVFDFKGL